VGFVGGPGLENPVIWTMYVDGRIQQQSPGDGTSLPPQSYYVSFCYSTKAEQSHLSQVAIRPLDFDVAQTVSLLLISFIDFHLLM